VELKKRFKHVIVSDIAEANIEKARSRLGTDGYSYHTAKVENASHLDSGSVDMVFASNVMQYPDVDAAQKSIAAQLETGGTFVCAGFAMALFDNKEIGAQMQEMIYTSMRAMLRTCADADDEARRIRIMAGIATGFQTVPADEKFFLRGVQRLTIHGGIAAVPYAPPEVIARFPKDVVRVGRHDQFIQADDPGWECGLSMERLKDNLGSFAFMKADPSALEQLWRNLEELIPPGTQAKGVWPCTLILATRR